MIFDRGSTFIYEMNTWAGYNGISTLLWGGLPGFMKGCVVDMPTSLIDFTFLRGYTNYRWATY